MKRVYILADAIEAAEVWPNGNIALHLSNGETHTSTQNQQTGEEVMEYIKATMVTLRGDEITEETEAWD